MSIVRRLLQLLLALAVVWALYLVAINAWIQAGGYSKLLASESDVDGWVQSAYSVWPGVIEGRGYHLVVHDPEIEAHLFIERFWLLLDPTRVGEKTVHIPRVRGQGLSFRLRATRSLESLCQQPPGLPPIPGLADPPGVVSGACLDQEDTAHPPGEMPDPSGVVRVLLGKVVADPITEIWIEASALTKSDPPLLSRSDPPLIKN